MARTVSGIRMRQKLRDADTPKKKLGLMFDFAEQVQQQGYCVHCVRLVLRAIMRVVGELQIVVEHPKGPQATKAWQKAAQQGLVILLGAAVKAGTTAAVSAAAGAIGKTWSKAGSGGAKKAPKAAPKAAKRG